MDSTDNPHGDGTFAGPFETSPQSPRKLPDDLPTSLDDRRPFSSYGGETEIYDGWQGNVSFQLLLLVPAHFNP